MSSDDLEEEARAKYREHRHTSDVLFSLENNLDKGFAWFLVPFLISGLLILFTSNIIVVFIAVVCGVGCIIMSYLSLIIGKLGSKEEEKSDYYFGEAETLFCKRVGIPCYDEQVDE